MQDIVILGAGGFAREVAWLVEEINRQAPRWRILGFSDIDATKRGSAVGKWHVRFSDDELVKMGVAVAVGVGSPSVLTRTKEQFGSLPAELLPNLLHPSVLCDLERVSLGVGNVICAGNILTTDVRIGSFNILNLSCTVGHDTTVADCCVINPGCNLSGGVQLGSGTLLGTGAKVLQYLRIGDRATVGAGAVVTKDVEESTTVVGVPARPLAGRNGR